jgi:hypothetical protein
VIISKGIIPAENSSPGYPIGNPASRFVNNWPDNEKTNKPIPT